MAKYKIKIEYENTSNFEVVEINCSNRKEAEQKCLAMAEDLSSLKERLSKKNVFTSKQFKSCNVVEPNLQESLQIWLEIEEMFRSKKLENDV